MPYFDMCNNVHPSFFFLFFFLVNARPKPWFVCACLLLFFPSTTDNRNSLSTLPLRLMTRTYMQAKAMQGRTKNVVLLFIFLFFISSSNYSSSHQARGLTVERICLIRPFVFVIMIVFIVVATAYGHSFKYGEIYYLFFSITMRSKNY